MERDARKLRKLPLVLLAGLLLLCLGLYGFLYYFGSPLLPGSLERRYAGQVEAHQRNFSRLPKQPCKPARPRKSCLCLAP